MEREKQKKTLPVEKKILQREQKYNWDRIEDRETLIVRRMLYDDPVQVFNDYNEYFLKKLFLKKLHLFDKLNRNFWKFILRVNDEEFDRATKENPHLAFKVWNM